MKKIVLIFFLGIITNSGFAQLWKKVGFENAYGALLKVGNSNVATMWLLADKLELTSLFRLVANLARRKDGHNGLQAITQDS